MTPSAGSYPTSISTGVGCRRPASTVSTTSASHSGTGANALLPWARCGGREHLHRHLLRHAKEGTRCHRGGAAVHATGSDGIAGAGHGTAAWAVHAPDRAAARIVESTYDAGVDGLATRFIGSTAISSGLRMK